MPGRTQELRQRGRAVSATGPLPSVACSSMHFAYHAAFSLADPPADGSPEALQPRRDNGCRLSRRSGLGWSPFARHYSGSRGFFPFLWVLRCFSSPACRTRPMGSGARTTALPVVGCPIRRSRDRRSVSTSPGLIAAAHVLHRLLAPRHPPCALRLLIVKNTLASCYGVFKVRAERVRRDAGRRPVSQNSAARRRPPRSTFV